MLTVRNRDAENQYNRDRYQRNVEFVRSQKTGPCADCGIVYPHYVMDFDHRGDKRRIISNMTRYSLESIKAEIAKCDLVCANCHRIRTFKGKA